MSKINAVRTSLNSLYWLLLVGIIVMYIISVVSQDVVMQRHSAIAFWLWFSGSALMLCVAGFVSWLSRKMAAVMESMEQENL